MPSQNYIILQDGGITTTPFSQVVVDNCGLDLCVPAKAGETLPVILKRICSEIQRTSSSIYITDGLNTTVAGSGTQTDPYRINASGNGGIGGGFPVGLEMPIGFSVSNTPLTSAGNLVVTTPLDGLLKAASGGFGVVDVLYPLKYVNGQLSHEMSGVTAGTYNNVTVDSKGHITNGSNIGYLITETDPVWNAQKNNYYTKTELQTSGASQVNWGNITNKPNGGNFIFNQIAVVQPNSNFWINATTSGATIARFGANPNSSVNITNGSILIENVSPTISLRKTNSGGSATLSFIPTYNTVVDPTHPSWSLGINTSETRFSILRSIGSSPITDLSVENNGYIRISSLKTTATPPISNGSIKYVTSDADGQLSFQDSSVVHEPVKEVRFRVDDTNALASSNTTSFILKDCDGVTLLNKKIKFYRERALQYQSDDYNYDPTTGVITVLVKFYTGERIVVEAHPMDLWVECQIGVTPANAQFPYIFPLIF